MNLLIDENLPRPIIERLINDGHVTELVSETALGMADDAILRAAGKDQVILTEDKDFGELVFRDRLATRGVVLVRLEGVSLPRRAEIVSGVVAEFAHRLLGSFTVIGHGGVRHQRLSDAD